MVELNMNNLQSAFDTGLDVAQPALFALGFVFGATEADATFNNQSNPNAGYTTNIPWRVTDTLTHLGIANVTVTKGFTSKAMPVTIKPLGFLNKGLVAAGAVWLYKEAKLPYYREIYKAVFPFGVGYSIGGVIDPSPNANAIHSPAGYQYQVAADYPAMVGMINSQIASTVHP